MALRLNGEFRMVNGELAAQDWILHTSSAVDRSVHSPYGKPASRPREEGHSCPSATQAGAWRCA